MNHLVLEKEKKQLLAGFAVNDSVAVDELFYILCCGSQKQLLVASKGRVGWLSQTLKQGERLKPRHWLPVNFPAHEHSLCCWLVSLAHVDRCD